MDQPGCAGVNLVFMPVPVGPMRKIGKMIVPIMGTCYATPVQIIAKRTLRVFWEDHPQARTPLQSWFATVSKSAWNSPADAAANASRFGEKTEFGATVGFVADNRVIFDIAATNTGWWCASPTRTSGF